MASELDRCDWPKTFTTFFPFYEVVAGRHVLKYVVIDGYEIFNAQFDEQAATAREATAEYLASIEKKDQDDGI